MFERNFAEHLDEAAVAIVGEARIVRLLREAGGGVVVQAQVENGVHHAGHGELCAGADAEQHRVIGVAELLAHGLFELDQALVDLAVDFGRNLLLVIEVNVADLRGDGEAGGDGQSGAAHLRESGAFAAENIFHLAVAVGGTAAEGIYVLTHLFS